MICWAFSYYATLLSSISPHYTLSLQILQHQKRNLEETIDRKDGGRSRFVCCNKFKDVIIIPRNYYSKTKTIHSQLFTAPKNADWHSKYKCCFKPVDLNIELFVFYAWVWNLVQRPKRMQIYDVKEKGGRKIFWLMS